MQINDTFQGGKKALEVVSLDRGPGIKDLMIDAEKSKNAHKKGASSSLGLHNICSMPDILEMESQGKKWMRNKEEKTFHDVQVGRVKKGCYFRMIVDYDKLKDPPSSLVKIVVD